MGAAAPSWPTTPVSTAPRIGTVALEITIGTAMRRTRAWVTARAGSLIAPRHEEMPRGLREGAAAVVLPRLDMDAGIAPPRTVDLRARIGVARQPRAQVIDREIDRLGQARQAPLRQRVGIDRAALDLLPEGRPAQPDDRGDLEKRGGGPAVQRRQDRVADELVVEGHHRGELVAAPLERDAEKPDVRNTVHERLEGGVAALLDHLHGIGTRAGHHPPSTVKVPVAVATGREVSSSTARARTKATERVM